jgi:crossover junction endodeoxyribonuclease RuvC
MTAILAIDPGTHCGYAVSINGTIVASGVWNLQPRRFEGGGMRYLRLTKYLSEINVTHPITAVYFEEVRRHLGTDAAHIYGGIIATIGAWCEERQIPYQGIPVATIKQAATGKGNSNKEAMVAAAAKRWPNYECVDDNEADARWCAVAAENS